MPFQTPETEGGDYKCRLLYIPNDPQWLAVVGGALEPLTKPYNWEHTGSVTPRRAAEIASAMLQQFYNAGCEGGGSDLDVRQNQTSPCKLEKQIGGIWTQFADLKLCQPLIRATQSGGLEFSYDGEQWQEIKPPIPPVQGGTTAENKRCIAAASAAEVLDLTLQEVNRQWQAGVLPLAMAAGIVAFFAALFFYPPAALVVGSFVVELVGLLDTLGGLANISAQTKDDLICILYCASTESEGVVTFNFSNVLQDVDEHTGQLTDWDAVRYLLNIIGEDGLNRAGATGVATSEICTCPECDPQSCPVVTFEPGGANYQIVYGSLLTGAGENGGTVLQGEKLSASLYRVRLIIPMSCHMMSFSYRYKYEHNRGDTRLSRGIEVRNAQGVLLTNSGTGGLIEHFGEGVWRTMTLSPYNVGSAATLMLDLAWNTSPNAIGYIYLDTITINGNPL